jgi:hypothetical protein
MDAPTPRKSHDHRSGWRKRGDRLLSFSTLTATVTLLIAVWGAITGTIAWTESREISVTISASTYAGFGPEVSEQISFSMINASSRAVSIAHGEVLLSGRPVGEVSSVTTEGRSASGVPNPALPLPTAIAADASTNFIMEWDVSPTAVSVVRAASKQPIGHRNLELRVTLVPGGTRLVHIRTGHVLDPVGGWAPYVVVIHNRAVALLLSTATASTPAVQATLQVWSAVPGETEPVLTIRRPAAYGGPAWFTLTSLKSGGYVYGISNAGTTLVAGGFQVRCTARDGLYYASACIKGNASPYPPAPIPEPPGLP